MKLRITMFQIDFGDGPKEYLTCADIERLTKGRGIPVEALIGAVLRPREHPSDPLTPENFMQNTAFINFLQGLMAVHGQWMDEMRINAEARGNGVLYVIDERAPRPVEGQEWEVRSDDLIGEFDVKDGEIVPGSYRRNPDFAVLNEEGLFRLTDEIAETVMVAIENLPDPGDPTPSWGIARINQIVNLTQQESEWNTHLESLTDEQLLSITVDDICSGLLDRAERLRKSYLAERRRRNL